MKRSLMFFALSLLATALVAFEDKPALSTSEKAGKFFARAGSAVGGAIAGGAVGGTAGSLVKVPYVESKSFGLEDHRQTSGAAMAAGTALGAGAGGTAAYMGAKHANLNALAKKHKVTPKAEAASQHYNVNIEQYRPLFDALDSGNKEQISSAIHALWDKRFGKGWQQEMSKTKTAKFKLGANYLRFLQLGALIGNIYLNEKLVSPKNPKVLEPIAMKAYEAVGIKI